MIYFLFCRPQLTRGGCPAHKRQGEMIKSLLHKLLSGYPWIFRMQQRICSSNYRDIDRAFNGILPQDGSRVLDIGCGTSDCAKVLFDNFRRHKYTGIDNNPQYIASNTARFPHAEFILADRVTEELIRGASFDCALVFSVLHHLTDEQSADLISQLKRVIVPGGVILVAEPTFWPGEKLGLRQKISNFLLSMDRGGHVRTEDRYAALFGGMEFDRTFVFTSHANHRTWGARVVNKK
jgi:ubiquinone/menaquinone biosynthesis C-methylase UbiE